jgi:hypothetical protein
MNVYTIIIYLMSITFEAQAIASCESGNGLTFGTIDWSARSITQDGGAFQFNDATWATMKVGASYAQADMADPVTQYKAFTQLWDDGRGWRHWRSSQACWSQWLDVVDNVAVRKEQYATRTGVEMRVAYRKLLYSLYGPH